MGREKSWKVIFTFHTTTQAMKMERKAQQMGKIGRLIPVPRQISAGCGMAWMAPKENGDELREWVVREEIEVEGEYDLFM